MIRQILQLFGLTARRYARHNGRQKRPRTPNEQARFDASVAELAGWFGVPADIPNWGKGPVPDHLISIRDRKLKEMGVKRYDGADYRLD